MKKYLLLMLLVLIGMGASASTDEIQLTWGETTSSSDGWSSLVVTNAKKVIKEGDLLIFSFDAASSTDQYAISNENGVKIYTEGCKDNEDWYDCANGQKDFVLTVTRKFYDDIHNGGLRLQYKGLKNLNGHIKRFEDGNFYKPTGSNVTEIMSTPQHIENWYSNGFVLKTDHDYVNWTLRVVCKETGDDAYAFLKRNDDGWPSLMSGSDKFSIAGWKYFEIKINGELNGLLRGNGLRIGGNNYYIAGIYVYDDGTTAPNWTADNSDIVDTYTFSQPIDGSKGWANYTISGSFFEFKGRGQQRAIEPTKKIANTKNNIIRLYLENTASNTQIYAKDAVDSRAAYIRERKQVENTDSFYYQNFADCGVADHYDFELSDAITVFEDYNKPITNNPEGVKTGMLSTLLLNGMNVGINHGKIWKLEIRKSMVSKYVTGYAIYMGHKLSNTYWRSVALPYNLSREQLKKAFGDDVVICELGKSAVTKEKTTEEGNLTHYHYGISFNFTKIPDTEEGINANYPYMIKLKNGVKENDSYPIENVKADVRDYQAYEFRTGKFDLSALDAKEPTAGDANYDNLYKIYDHETKIRTQLTDKVRMIFKSTAPVFDITNTEVGNVEMIKGTSNKTVLNTPRENTDDPTNYYLYDNVLYPVKDTPVKLSSGLAYVVLPAETRSLFDNQPDDAAQAGAKITYFFCDENETTGIEEIDMTPASVCKAQQNVYSLDGQLVHKGLSVEGLAKGIYIVNGKKVIIK
ncbi:MAG TPA: hypothetical protein PLP97_01670 [Prevotella sp.]|nr:hypothetical protein [Prevotella sp.]